MIVKGPLFVTSGHSVRIDCFLNERTLLLHREDYFTCFIRIYMSLIVLKHFKVPNDGAALRKRLRFHSEITRRQIWVRYCLVCGGRAARGPARGPVLGGGPGPRRRPAVHSKIVSIITDRQVINHLKKKSVPRQTTPDT